MAGVKFDFKLVTKKGEFRGAMHTYDVDGTKIPVAFTTNEAFIMKDAIGLYGEADIKHNLKQLGMEAAETSEAISLCNVECATEDAEDLGFTEEQIKDMITKVQELNKLEEERPYM